MYNNESLTQKIENQEDATYTVASNFFTSTVFESILDENNTVNISRTAEGTRYDIDVTGYHNNTAVFHSCSEWKERAWKYHYSNQTSLMIDIEKIAYAYTLTDRDNYCICNYWSNYDIAFINIDKLGKCNYNTPYYFEGIPKLTSSKTLLKPDERNDYGVYYSLKNIAYCTYNSNSSSRYVYRLFLPVSLFSTYTYSADERKWLKNA